MTYPMAAVRGRVFLPQYKWYEEGGAPVATAVWRPKGAASYAASKQNILSPGTHDLSDGVAYPTWDTSYGWAYDATSSQYLLSDIKPNYASFDVCTIIRVSDFSYTGAPVDQRNMFGLTNYGIQAAYFTNQISFNNGSTDTDIDGTGITGGVFCINGNDVGGTSADKGAFYNGVKVGDILKGTGSGQDNIMAVGAFRSGSAHSNFFNGKIQAMVHYDQLLTAAQVAAVSAAMAAL